MRPTASILVALVAVPALAGAEPPTFTRDVLPILQKNCQTCHRAAGTNMAGMIAPMSLGSYEEVRPWTKAIANVVRAKLMPPWHASEATHGQFRNERTLAQPDIETIVKWTESGAPRGDPSDAPAAPPVSNAEWSIGEPDLIVTWKDPYFIPDDVADVQPFIQVTLTPEQLPETKWVKAIEFKPGSEVVHHIVTFLVKPGETLNPQTQQLFGIIAPGTDAQKFDDGYGIEVQPGSTVGFAMHYHKEAGPGTAAYDQSLMALKFHDKPVEHPLEISPLTYGVFEVPPGHQNWKVGAAYIFPEDVLLLQFMPHTHLRGSAARYTAYYPDGTEEVLLDIPRYDYNWQTGYDYKTYKEIPAGTRVEWELWYDNSAEKGAEAGFDSTVPVVFGGPTTDEMDLGWITYTSQRKGIKPDKFPSAPIPTQDVTTEVVALH